MARFQLMLLVTLLFFASFQFGASLNCYNCTSAISPNCKDHFKGDAPKATCAAAEVCIKHVQPQIAFEIDEKSKTHLPEIVIRACKPEIYCGRVSGFKEFCKECKTDLCNSSSVAVPSFLSLLYALIRIIYN